MSLINNMLLDLEHREGSAGKNHSRILGGLSAARVGREQRGRPVRRYILAATLGIGVTVAIYLVTGPLTPVQYSVGRPMHPVADAEQNTARSPLAPKGLAQSSHEQEQAGPFPDSFDVEPSVSSQLPAALEAVPDARQGELASRSHGPEYISADRALPASAVPTKPDTEVDLDDETIPGRQPRSEANAPRRTETADRGAAPPVSFARVPVTSAPAQVAEAYYREAQTLLQGGENGPAHELLDRALETYPAHVPAREALAGQLVQAGRLAEAGDLLAHGLEVFPEHSGFAKLYARILVEEGKTADALQILAGLAPAIVDDPEFYAFRAALLQRVGEHRQAQSLYRAALAVRPITGIWWTGLAISMEALGNRNEAAEAYRHALSTGALPAEVLDFVKRKVSLEVVP